MPEKPGSSSHMPNPNNKLSHKVHLPKLHLGKSSRSFSLQQLIIFALVFGAIGLYFLWRSFAAGPAVLSVQAEAMSLPTGATVVSEASASASKAVRLSADGSLNASISLPSPAASVTITARAEQCQGAPALSATLDGKSLLSATSVTSTSYSAYAASGAFVSGTHSLSLSGANLGAVYAGKSGKVKCSRVLYVDVTTFYAPDTTPPASITSFTANPTSVASGSSSTLSWTSSNASSCSASGAWSGTKATSGSETTAALSANSVFNLSCSGSGGSDSKSLTVSVSSTTPSGFLASYYDNIDFTNLKLTRNDDSINFDWGIGSPDPSIALETYSIRWTGSFKFDAADYIFTTTADDGVRIYVDGQLVIDQWIDQSPTTYSASRTMTAGDHTVRMDYYQRYGGATAKLSWSKGSTTTPPPAGFPSSYFTGPLGQNNILPPATTGALVGLWAPGTDVTTITNHWNSRQSHFGRKLDIYGIHYAAPTGGAYYSGHVPYTGAHGENYAINQGGIPYISWMPGFTLSQINSGQADAAFRDVARKAAAWGQRHLYRPFWEFNGGWFSWSGTGQAHIDAWRRVVNIYKQEGATNVGFLWCPDEGNWPGTRESYPGDQYVDWVCSDRYQWPSEPWKDFSYWFDDPASNAALIHDNFGPRKPHIIGEYGAYESSTAGQKAQWITNHRNYIKNSMPYVKAVVYFDTIADGVNWRLDTSTSALDAYRDLVRDSFFNTRNR